MNPPDFKNYRILIADDNTIELDVMKEMAEELGVQCEIAADGEEALQKLTDSPVGYFSLFLSDIFMPKMKGYEAAMKFRNSAREDARTLPIIGISAETDPRLYDIAISSGMSSMTLKPVTEAMLTAYFTLFLNERRANTVFSAQMQNRVDSERRMREFIQTISTELRTPLSGIMEFANLLKSGEISGDEAKNFADVIISATERIYNILNSKQMDYDDNAPM